MKRNRTVATKDAPETSVIPAGDILKGHGIDIWKEIADSYKKAKAAVSQAEDLAAAAAKVAEIALKIGDLAMRHDKAAGAAGSKGPQKLVINLVNPKEHNAGN